MTFETHAALWDIAANLAAMEACSQVAAAPLVVGAAAGLAVLAAGLLVAWLRARRGRPRG